LAIGCAREKLKDWGLKYCTALYVNDLERDWPSCEVVEAFTSRPSAVVGGFAISNWISLPLSCFVLYRLRK